MTTLRYPVTESDHLQGNRSAAVTLLEYGDYECPFCGKAYLTVKKIQEEFGDKINFVFRNFALTKIHPHAFLAAVSTEAAAKQNAFWEMHDLVFEHQSKLSRDLIVSLAEQLNLDKEQFLSDIEDETLKEKVENDFMTGIRSGVNATPSFFINGEKLEAPGVFISLKNAINKALENAAE